MRTVIFLSIDGFRWDYLNADDTPFLHQMSREGLHIEKVIPTSGFVKRSAMLTGAYPDETLDFAMYEFSLEKSPYRSLHAFREPLRLIESAGENNKTVQKFHNRLRRRLLRYFRKKDPAAKPSEVPLSLLPYIKCSSSEKPPFEPGGLRKESIFDIIRGNKTFEYLYYPVIAGDDDRVMQETLKRIPGNPDLFMLQFSEVDQAGHIYGPDSPERREAARGIDNKIRILHDRFKQSLDDAVWLIVSDHGMTQVSGKLNAREKLTLKAREYGLKPGRDYAYFLDSTFIRIKYLNGSCSGIFSRIFTETPDFNKNGTIVDLRTAKEHHIPVPSQAYGDLAWWADPGVVIEPDFFNIKNTIKGMHGYLSTDINSLAFALISGRGIPRGRIGQGDLVDICPTLCDILQIRYPAANKGKSWLGRSEGE